VTSYKKGRAFAVRAEKKIRVDNKENMKNGTDPQ